MSGLCRQKHQQRLFEAAACRLLPLCASQQSMLLLVPVEIDLSKALSSYIDESENADCETANPQQCWLLRYMQSR